MMRARSASQAGAGQPDAARLSKAYMSMSADNVWRKTSDPYLRRLWLLGWIGVCPRHRTQLIGECPGCRFRSGSKG